MNTNKETETVARPPVSEKALALVSEFALVLYRHNGKLISVYSKDVTVKILEQAEICDNDHLRSIFSSLKAELEQHEKAIMIDQKADILKRQLQVLAQ